jgi:hypothetical protein
MTLEVMRGEGETLPILEALDWCVELEVSREEYLDAHMLTGGGTGHKISIEDKTAVVGGDSGGEWMQCGASEWAALPSP